MQSEPKNTAVMCNLAWALAQKGELNESLSLYQKALELVPGTVEAQAGQGVVLFRLGKTEASLAVLKEAVHSKPDNANLRLALGGVLQAAERYEEGLAELQEAMKLAPNNFEVKTRLAAAYLDCEKSSKSVELYRQLIERSPTNAELRMGLGLALIKGNDINGAYIQFKKASELDKNSASAHAALSMVEEMRGRLSQAESEARIAQEKDPESQFFKESAERLAKSKVDSEM
ncbi:MAG: tetratricopeptide repeat protein [Candidatus Obscuribacterales bacterium]|nr:tetratricopeptide repeat protein [Candidatus Obscuribacterales bacterium]